MWFQGHREAPAVHPHVNRQGGPVAAYRYSASSRKATLHACKVDALGVSARRCVHGACVCMRMQARRRRRRGRRPPARARRRLNWRAGRPARPRPRAGAPLRTACAACAPTSRCDNKSSPGSSSIFRSAGCPPINEPGMVKVGRMPGELVAQKRCVALSITGRVCVHVPCRTPTA